MNASEHDGTWSIEANALLLLRFSVNEINFNHMWLDYFVPEFFFKIPKNHH